MPGKNDKKNPVAFLAIGVCFMGAGVALTTALHAEGASAVGIGIIGIGVIFLLLGVAQMRRV